MGDMINMLHTFGFVSARLKSLRQKCLRVRRAVWGQGQIGNLELGCKVSGFETMKGLSTLCILEHEPI